MYQPVFHRFLRAASLSVTNVRAVQNSIEETVALPQRLADGSPSCDNSMVTNKLAEISKDPLGKVTKGKSRTPSPSSAVSCDGVEKSVDNRAEVSSVSANKIVSAPVSSLDMIGVREALNRVGNTESESAAVETYACLVVWVLHISSRILTVEQGWWYQWHGCIFTGPAMGSHAKRGRGTVFYGLFQICFDQLAASGARSTGGTRVC